MSEDAKGLLGWFGKRKEDVIQNGMRAHALSVLDCVTELGAAMRAMETGDSQAALKAVERLYVLEHEADAKAQVLEWVKAEAVTYRIVTVFDVSQTEGKELPTLGVMELSGDVAEYERIVLALAALSPLPVVFEAFLGAAKGYCSYVEQRIVIQPGMSQVQTIKTLVHEVAHAKLHSPLDILEETRPDRSTREVEAESVAYVVCQHFGIDTADYSFAYVADWSRGRELEVLKASLDRIHTTAAELIAGMEGQEKEVEKTPPPRRQRRTGRTGRNRRQDAPAR